MKDAGDALPPGTRLEPFVLERFLGLGGLGVTYLARDESLGVWRAVKEYLPDAWGARLADGTVGPRVEAYAEDYIWGMNQFLQEARILAQLESRHVRHIVRVYQVFRALGTAYMVMEYVEGRTLEAEVESAGPLSEARVRGLLGALTEGLSAVHAKGILHRDITPRNVMIRDDGTPVLIDFGAARQATGDRSGDVRQFLTPGFAPLEQYVTRTRRGSSSSVKLRQGPWTDIYALGAVAYWSMSRAEYRERLDEAPARQAADDLPRLSEAAGRSVSGSLSLAVSSALAVYGEDRPQSVEEWRGLLEGPAVAEPKPPWWWRWRLGAASAVVSMVVVLVALLAFRYGGVGGGPVEIENRPGGPSTTVSEPAAPSPEEVEAGLGLDGGSRRLIELGLASLGFYPGLVDGEFGGTARRALRGWQGSRGEWATGYLDAGSASALLSAGRDPRGGTVFRECGACPELVVVPAGSFMMGSPASEAGRQDDEGPQRRVRVERFALGWYEVTRAEYAVFARATGRGDGGGCYAVDGDGAWGWSDDASWRSPGFRQTDDHPAVCVSWDDASAYVRWLSRETGREYRLPSESEWEYAARGGTSSSRYWGEGSSSQCGYANGADASAKRRFEGLTVASCDDGRVFTVPVGTFRANGFGVLDVLGNVTEWVEDCWHDDYRGAPSDGRAWTGGGDCGLRVLRGGSWHNSPRYLRSSDRGRSAAGLRFDDRGFRVSRTLLAFD